MTKKIFAIRLSLYVVFGAIIPIGFLAWRFKLFDKVTTISFSVWGLVAMITVIIFALKLLIGFKKGLKHGIPKQVVDTVCDTTIPLLIFTVAFDWMSDFAIEFVQFLIVLIVSETVAGILNPLPQWCHENKIEETQGVFKKILGGFMEKK